MKNLLVAILFLSVPASAQQAQLQTFSPERSSAFRMLSGCSSCNFAFGRSEAVSSPDSTLEAAFANPNATWRPEAEPSWAWVAARPCRSG